MPITIKNSAGGGVTLDSTTSSNETLQLPSGGGTLTNTTDLALKAPIASPVFTGNVGVGVTPEAWLSSQTALQFGGVGTVSSTTAQAAGGDVRLSNNTYINTSDVDKYTVTDEASMYRQINGTHIWYVAPSGTADASVSWTNAMNIDNAGMFELGSFSATGASLGYLYEGTVSGAAHPIVSTSCDSTSSRVHRRFYNPNGMVGHILTDGSSTSYNTSSDYRLKENVTPMSGATAQTKLLKPCNFDWIAGGNVNGFIAHELAEVVPEAVTGTKDAMRDEEYEVTPATDTEAAVMGTRSVPDMQGIDQAKLVPLLTATIQELIARIEALENV